jgi:hypothetical protein
MRALVVYESMYGNTHAVADQIASGLRPKFEATVVPVAGATADLVRAADLLVVGGPTHVHGMSSEMSRRAARDATEKDVSLALDPDAEGEGLRDWFKDLSRRPIDAAAFDTRMPGAPSFTGRASKGIARRLRDHGFRLVVEPESFLVDKANHLIPGEGERAEAWAASLAASIDAARIG